jgi:hypothetical protein
LFEGAALLLENKQAIHPLLLWLCPLHAVVEKKLYAEDALALPKGGANVTTSIGEDLKIYAKYGGL